MKEGRGTQSQKFIVAIPYHSLGLFSLTLGVGMCPYNSPASRVLTPTPTWHQYNILWYLLRP